MTWTEGYTYALIDPRVERGAFYVGFVRRPAPSLTGVLGTHVQEVALAPPSAVGPGLEARIAEILDAGRTPMIEHLANYGGGLDAEDACVASDVRALEKDGHVIVQSPALLWDAVSSLAPSLEQLGAIRRALVAVA